MYAALAKTAQSPKPKPYFSNDLHPQGMPNTDLLTQTSNKKTPSNSKVTNQFTYSARTSPSRSQPTLKHFKAATKTSTMSYSVLSNSRPNLKGRNHSLDFSAKQDFSKSTGNSTPSSKRTSSSLYALYGHGPANSSHLEKYGASVLNNSSSMDKSSNNKTKSMSVGKRDQPLSQETYTISVIRERLDSEGYETKRSASVFLESDRITQVNLQTEYKDPLNRPAFESDKLDMRATSPSLSEQVPRIEKDSLLVPQQNSRAESKSKSKLRSINYHTKQSAGQFLKSSFSYPLSSVFNTLQQRQEAVVSSRARTAGKISASVKGFKKSPGLLEQSQSLAPSSIHSTKSNTKTPSFHLNNSSASLMGNSNFYKSQSSPQKSDSKIQHGTIPQILSPSRNTMDLSPPRPTQPYYLSSCKQTPEKSLLITVSSDNSVNLDDSGDHLLYRKNITRSLGLLREKRISLSTLSVLPAPSISQLTCIYRHSSVSTSLTKA